MSKQHGMGKGLACAALSAVLFGASPLLAQWTYRMGSNSVTLAFFRGILSMPTLWLLVRLQGGTLRLTRWQLRGGLACGLLLGITTIMYYSAFAYISVGATTTLHFTYPLIVAVGCAALYKERVPPMTWVALAAGAAGVALLAGTLRGSLPGMLLALGSGFAFAGYIICANDRAVRSIPPFVLSFYLAAVLAALAGGVGALSGGLRLDLPPQGWALTFLVAQITMVGACALLQLGVRWAGATNAATLSLLEPLTGVAVGALLLGEALLLPMAIGCGLIVAGMLCLVLSNARSPRKSQ